MATKFSRFVDNLFGFTTLLTESKCYISVLRYVSPNDMVYFSPRALFLQVSPHIKINLGIEFGINLISIQCVRSNDFRKWLNFRHTYRVNC